MLSVAGGVGLGDGGCFFFCAGGGGGSASSEFAFAAGEFCGVGCWGRSLFLFDSGATTSTPLIFAALSFCTGVMFAPVFRRLPFVFVLITPGKAAPVSRLAVPLKVEFGLTAEVLAFVFEGAAVVVGAVMPFSLCPVGACAGVTGWPFGSLVSWVAF